MQTGRNDTSTHLFLPPFLPLVGRLAGECGEVLGVYVLHDLVPVERDVACDDGELLGSDHGYERYCLAIVL